ncbi:MAG TPA: hypothetical protein VII33_19680 [Nakamurella sp.]
MSTRPSPDPVADRPADGGYRRQGAEHLEVARQGQQSAGPVASTQPIIRTLLAWMATALVDATLNKTPPAQEGTEHS